MARSLAPDSDRLGHVEGGTAADEGDAASSLRQPARGRERASLQPVD
jgi:hypothetical protein